MDAEIAMEMALERQRRLSTNSNNSSVGGTYVGPCPHSPGQVGDIMSLISQSWSRNLTKPETTLEMLLGWNGIK